MTDSTMLDSTLRGALHLANDVDLTGIAYGRTVEWDSVGHLELMLALESALSITLGPDDIMEMVDYRSIIQVVARHQSTEARY
jgi:acyl carrier protein